MKIAVIQLGRIGDMILMTPLFAEIKSLLPNSELTVFAGPSNYSIINNNPNINRVFVVEKNPLSIIKTILFLKMNKFDYWIDPKNHFSNESSILARLAKANCKIGYNRRDKKRVFDKDLPYIKENIHHTQIVLSALMPLGYEQSDIIPKPYLYSNIDSEKYLDSFLKTHNIAKFIILNISGSKEHKKWQNDYWVEFINKVPISYKIVLCYAPKDKQDAEYISSKNSSIILFHSRKIDDMISIVEKSEYIISPDTAIVHIAAAFNKPTFALYSGIDEFYYKFHPLSDIYIAVRAEQGEIGIKNISISKVIAEFEQFKKILAKNTQENY